MDLSISVDVVSSLTKEEFLRRYHRPQKPVVIKGLMQSMPAGEKWSLDWFKAEMGDEEIEVYDNEAEHHKYSAITEPDIKMSFGEYLDIIAKDEPTSLRMFLADLFKVNPTLRQDFPCPPIMKGVLGRIGYMFLGGKDTEVRMHFDIDASCVLLTQAFGHKKVRLFGPENNKLLYKLPLNSHSAVDLDHPDYDRYPGLRYVQGAEIILEPGDALYMPSRYWHHITYLDGGMGVSYRKLSPNPMDWLRGVAHLGLYMPLDKALNRLLGKRWYEYKEKVADQRAQKAIARLNGQPEPSWWDILTPTH